MAGHMSQRLSDLPTAPPAGGQVLKPLAQCGPLTVYKNHRHVIRQKCPTLSSDSECDSEEKFKVWFSGTGTQEVRGTHTLCVYVQSVPPETPHVSVLQVSCSMQA